MQPPILAFFMHSLVLHSYFESLAATNLLTSSWGGAGLYCWGGLFEIRLSPANVFEAVLLSLGCKRVAVQETLEAQIRAPATN